MGRSDGRGGGGKRRRGKRGEGKRVGTCVRLSNTNTKFIFPILPSIPFSRKKHSPYSDGQPVHPYQAGAAHTHHAPYVMPPSVGYLHPVKISAYHTIVPKERGGDNGEQRGKRRMWVGRRGRRGRGRRGEGGEEGEREGRRGRGEGGEEGGGRG